MVEKRKKNSTHKQKYLMLSAIILGGIFAFMLFTYAGFNFSDGKASLILQQKNQFTNGSIKIEPTETTYISKKLTACLASKGWLDRQFDYRSSKYTKYCNSFPSLNSLEYKPSSRDCKAYQAGGTSNINTANLDYKELAAACEIIYKPVPARPFEVELVSQLNEVNGFVYNHDVAVYRLSAPRDANILIDNLAFRYSAGISSYIEIDNRAWTLNSDDSRPLGLTDLGLPRIDGNTRINSSIEIDAGDTLEVAIGLRHDLDRLSDGESYTIELVADMLNPTNIETGELLEVRSSTLTTNPIEVVVDETPSTVSISRLNPESALEATGFTSSLYDERFCINHARTREYLGVIRFENDSDDLIQVNSVRLGIERESDIFDMFNIVRIFDGGAVSDAADVFSLVGEDEFELDLYRHNTFRNSAVYAIYTRGIYSGGMNPSDAAGEQLRLEILDVDAESLDRSDIEINLVPIPVELADLEIFANC